MTSIYKKRTSRVFKTFLISYIAILLLPMLIGSIAYQQAGKMLEEEAVRSNSAMLEQLRLVLDSRLKEIDQLADQMALDNNIRQYIYANEALDPVYTYNVSQMVKQLSVYKNVNEFVDDFYIYFPSSNTILTPTSKYDPESFYRNVYSYKNIDYKEWKEHIISGQYFRKYLLEEASPVNSQDSNMITYIHTIPLNRQENYYANVVILIDKQKLNVLLNSISSFSKGRVYILDEKNEVIVSSDNSSSLPGYFINIASENEGLSISKVEGNKNIISSILSNQTKWKYVTEMPRTIFMQKVVHIRNTTIWIVVACMVLGTTLAAFMSNRNYNPLKKLAETLSDKIGSDAAYSSNDEYKFIQQVMSSTLNQSSEIEKQLVKHKPVFKVDILRRLLKGNFDSNEALAESLGFCNIDFIGDRFIVFLIQIEDNSSFIRNESEHEWRLARFTVSNIVNELVGQMGETYTLDLEKNLMGVIVCFDNNFDDGELVLKLCDIIYEFQGFLQQKLKIDTSIFVGDMCKGITGISDSYQQSVKAMNYRIVKGSSSVIVFSRLGITDSSYYYPIEIEMQLMNFVKAADSVQALNILDRVFEENYTNDNLPHNLARCLFFDIMSTMVKILNDININSKDVFGSGFDPVEQLYKCDTVGQMHNKQREIITNICSYINSNKRSRNTDLKDGIIDYIERNYDDQNLCLASISDKFNITTAYLSFFFKEQTGNNISNYINTIRIEHAKQFLKNKEYSMSYIASQVGFSNDVALIRVFKKQEGVTPGKYREISVP